jgi:ribosomal protein L36
MRETPARKNSSSNREYTYNFEYLVAGKVANSSKPNISKSVRISNSVGTHADKSLPKNCKLVKRRASLQISAVDVRYHVHSWVLDNQAPWSASTRRLAQNVESNGARDIHGTQGINAQPFQSLGLSRSSVVFRND